MLWNISKIQTKFSTLKALNLSFSTETCAELLSCFRVARISSFADLFLSFCFFGLFFQDLLVSRDFVYTKFTQSESFTSFPCFISIKMNNFL